MLLDILYKKVLTYLYREAINLADDFNLSLSNWTYGGRRQRKRKNTVSRLSLSFVSEIRRIIKLNYLNNSKLMIFLCK